MGTILVAALLSLVFVYAIYSYVRKLRQGGGCCGGHEPAEKKVKVADRDKRYYPYTVTLTVDGMTCGNCVRRVENALNRLDGVWAEVDLGAHRATVRTKQRPDEAALRQAVRGAGYLVLSVEQAD